MAVEKEKEDNQEISKLSLTKSPEEMISLAIEKGVSVETMERLLEMMKDVNAIRAKAQFTQAMADFQSECPTIEKKREIKNKDGSVKYKYAPLDSIVDQVKVFISKNGLSYTIKTTSDDKYLTATCKITHLAGHSEESSFIVPIGAEQYMTEVQKFGARATFAKRYAFCDAFGIMTGDEDKDATADVIQDNQRQATTMPTQDQYDIFTFEMKRTGATRAILEGSLKKKLEKLTSTQLVSLIKQLQARPDKIPKTAPVQEKVELIDPDTGKPITDAEIC